RARAVAGRRGGRGRSDRGVAGVVPPVMAARSGSGPVGAVAPVYDRYHRRYQGGGVIGAVALAVLRPGDWVSFDGGDHQVVAVAGTSVRLRSTAGVEQVV